MNNPRTYHVTFAVTVDGTAGMAQITDAPEDVLGPECDVPPPKVPHTSDVVWRAISARADQIAAAVTEHNSRVRGAFAVWGIIRDRVDEDTARSVWDEAIACGFLPEGPFQLSCDDVVHEAQRSVAGDAVLHVYDNCGADVANSLQEYLAEQGFNLEEE